MAVTLRGFRFSTPMEALQFAEADDTKAIQINGLNLVVTEEEATRLESLRVPFRYLKADGVGSFRAMPVS